MPFALTIGVPYELFFKLTPNKLPAFYKSYQQKKRAKDEEMYYQAYYNMRAFEVVIAHFAAGLSGKKSDAKFLERPILWAVYEEENLTQEERDRKEIEEMLHNEKLWEINDELRGLPETVIL